MRFNTFLCINVSFMRFKTLLCINVSFFPFLREILRTSIYRTTPGYSGHLVIADTFPGTAGVRYRQVRL